MKETVKQTIWRICDTLLLQQLAYKTDHFAYNIYILYLYVFVPYFVTKHR